MWGEQIEVQKYKEEEQKTQKPKENVGLEKMLVKQSKKAVKDPTDNKKREK